MLGRAAGENSRPRLKYGGGLTLMACGERFFARFTWQPKHAEVLLSFLFSRGSSVFPIFSISERGRWLAANGLSAAARGSFSIKEKLFLQKYQAFKPSLDVSIDEFGKQARTQLKTDSLEPRAWFQK